MAQVMAQGPRGLEARPQGPRAQDGPGADLRQDEHPGIEEDRHHRGQRVRQEWVLHHAGQLDEQCW